MMLLNEPKNVAENTGRVIIHTFQPGVKKRGKQFTPLFWENHEVFFNGNFTK